jgi:N,N'-diacetylchitobiose phosphorylase
MNYGYFDDSNREYVVTRPDTPGLWSNYMGSADFGAIITNNAAGYTFYKSAAQGRLSRFRFNGIPTEMPGKFIYLRDNESGDFWSGAWQPVAKDLSEYKYECRFGSGYTIISSEYSGISCEVTYFIPLHQLYEVWDIKLKNNSNKPRELSLFSFLEAQCNWNAQDDNINLQYCQYVSKTDFVDGIADIGSSVNMPEDPDNFTNKDQKRHTFMAMCGSDVVGHDGDRDEFIGTYGSYSAPVAVVEGKCNNSVATGGNPCAALQTDIELAPGEEKSLAAIFGVGEAGITGKEVREKMSIPGKVQDDLNDVKTHWHSRMNSLHADTPDASFNSMINMWAPFNNLMTFYWSRTASMIYAGERDGLGFRDTVQDIVGSSSLVTEESGECLELMLTGQMSNGGAIPVIKPFDHNPGHEPEPDHYRSDDSLWFFNAVPEYVKETGNFDFYNKVLPYADKGEATVFGHLRRAIEFNLERSGAHGLPCGLHADWNDCIRLGEKGETVFVAFQLRFGLREYIEIADRLGEIEEKIWAEAKLAELDENLEEFAWDGEWYLRAYRDDGLKFGSKENDEGSIFMNPQTWAVLSGHATEEKAEKCMQALDEQLATEFGVMVCTPPYVNIDPKIALGRLFNPGMKENGAIFNHTQGWGVMALSKLGKNQKAWEYLKSVMPASFNDKAEIRKVEPYVVCQSTHSKFSPRCGTGGLSWLSGSAVWNYYAMTNAILGIKPHYDGLEIDPCIPDEWNGYTATRHFRGCEFRISVKRGEKPEIKINGNIIEGKVIKAANFADVNKIEVTI